MPVSGDNEKLILWRLDQQDRAAAEHRSEVKSSLTRVFEVVTKTNGRVSSLERFKFMVMGALLVIVTLIGWLVSWGGLHK